MQVTLTLLRIGQDDESEGGGFLATFGIDSPEQARAVAARLHTELVLELPDAQPPDVFEVRIPEEEARTNAPRKAKK